MREAMIDRRDFLRVGLAGVSVASTYPLFLGRTAAVAAEEGPPANDRVLVVIQLSGGNDGLSTVVPYADPAYGRARSTIRIGEKEVIRIDEYLGLHAGGVRIPCWQSTWEAGLPWRSPGSP